MVLITALVGYYAGSGRVPEYLRLLQMLFGTALAAAGTLTLNQFLERDIDALMERTRRRPLPDSRVQPQDALWFGIPLTAAGSRLSGAQRESLERHGRRRDHE